MGSLGGVTVEVVEGGVAMHGKEEMGSEEGKLNGGLVSIVISGSSGEEDSVLDGVFVGGESNVTPSDINKLVNGENGCGVEGARKEAVRGVRGATGERGVFKGSKGNGVAGVCTSEFSSANTSGSV